MKCGYWRNLDSVGECAGIRMEWQITTPSEEEICLQRSCACFAGGATAVQERRASINEISPYTSQIEEAEFVTKVQPATKVFDHCMN